MKEGDLIEINTGSEKLRGVLMPSPKERVVIKLNSGYNLSLERKRVRMKLVDSQKKKKKAVKKVKEKKGLKRVVILHTGGTIASKVDYETGGTIAQFEPSEILEMFPEIKEIVNIKSRLVRNIMGEDMRFGHYNLIAKEIEKEIKKGADGVIITHGTDTMHYASAALSFILENLNIPVILVGAQRSSDRGSSDATVNLVSACRFIAKSDFNGVGICMHSGLDDGCVILPGLKVRKMHTSRRDAFKAINAKSVGSIRGGKVNVHVKNKEVGGKLKLRLFNEKLKVGFVKVHPQMSVDELKCYEKFDGLVIEATGLGHIPMHSDDISYENKKIVDFLKKLNIPVVVAPQTIYGRINMNVYSPGRELLKIGVIGDRCDITPETAFIKLAWLLSNYKKKEIKELFEKDLVGEINERIGGDEFDVY